MTEQQIPTEIAENASLGGTKPKSSEAASEWNAELERERTRSWLAKYSLAALFPAIVGSATYGFFSGHAEAYLLTAGLATPATMIVKSYFPSKIDKEK